MPDCDPGAGRLIMDRIAAAVPDTMVPPPSTQSPIRLAFACSPFDGESVRDLLRTAKARLDETGEPCIEVAPPVPGVLVGTAEGGGQAW